MKEQILKIISNKPLNECTYEMVLQGENLDMKSGQFVEIKLDNFYLRRPFSVAFCNSSKVTILYKVVGEGTKKMAQLQSNVTLSVLTNLGNSFNLTKSKNPLLIGGGIGSAPLFMLAKEFNEIGIKPTILLGFKNKSEIFYEDEFQKSGEVIIATDDGSYGYSGNVVSVLKEKSLSFDFFYACGPMVMLKSISEIEKIGEMSLEARMACGFGACMGCSIMTKQGPKRVCKEGPVFCAEEIVFQEKK